jgi:hypothetical protein
MKFQIPDEALDQLRSMLEQEGKYQWQIGQFLNDYWEEILKYIHPDEIADSHANMIKQFAKGTQADRTTLRDRKNMWTFFSDADRLEYEEYTYHWFRALKSAGSEWRYYASMAVQENWSIAQIRREINKDKDPLAVLYKRVDKIGKAARKLMDDEEVSKDIRESLSLIPTIISDTKDLINYE